MEKTNRLNRTISKLNLLPAPVRRRVTSLLLGRMVPFVGTSGLRIEEMTAERVVVSIRNRKRIQNHIRGVHAAAMALVAETASGFVVGMNLPDDKLPLIKSLHVDFRKRTRGNMHGVATLDEDQKRRMFTDERGDVSVEVHVSDESGSEPIQCQMVWAWVPKKR